MRSTNRPEVIRALFRLLEALLIFASPAFGGSADAGQRQVTRLANGVYAIQHNSLNDGNVNGNITVIIGDREVFVVDSCCLPSLARGDIAQIREWTDKPVRYLLNTHFHNDHNNGNKTYLDAFPSLAIVAQEETKKDMDLIQPGNVERAPKQMADTIAALKQGKLRANAHFPKTKRSKSWRCCPASNNKRRNSRRWCIRIPLSPFPND